MSKAEFLETLTWPNRKAIMHDIYYWFEHLRTNMDIISAVHTILDDVHFLTITYRTSKPTTEIDKSFLHHFSGHSLGAFKFCEGPYVIEYLDEAAYEMTYKVSEYN